jgi:hypothetical protein
MNTDNKKTETKQCTIPSVRRCAFTLDVDNWGLGTYLYAYLLWWVIIVALINIGVWL